MLFWINGKKEQNAIAFLTMNVTYSNDSNTVQHGLYNLLHQITFGKQLSMKTTSSSLFELSLFELSLFELSQYTLSPDLKPTTRLF